MVEKKVQHFGKYFLDRPLGAGGMAQVFLGRTKNIFGINKTVAIKIMQKEFINDIKMLEMFKHEASLAIQFNHNNVLGIIDYGVVQDQCYVAMDYISGFNLVDLRTHANIDFDGVPIPEILFIAKNITAGLDYAHRIKDLKTHIPLQLVHRDISPHNIMVSFEGDVKIIDFGVAKTIDSVDKSFHSVEVGKLRYMSPEQINGHEATQRSDMFSLGITIWELVTGVRIFEGKSHIEIISLLKDFRLPDIKTYRPDCPDYVITILEKVTNLNPAERYSSAGELHRDFSLMLSTHYPAYTQEDFRLKVDWLFRSKSDLIAKSDITQVIDKSIVNSVKIYADLTRREFYRLNPRYLVYLTIAAGMYFTSTYQDRIFNWLFPAGAAEYLQSLKSKVNKTPRSSFQASANTSKPEAKQFIKIRTAPPGAYIYIGNQLFEQKSPAEIEIPAGRSSRLTLRLKGYADSTIDTNSNMSDIYLHLSEVKN